MAYGYSRTMQYQVGGNQYDVDPQWASILYKPYSIDNFDTGFNRPSSVTPTPAPVDDNPNDGGGNDYGPGGKDSGGDNESRARGIDPNSGLNLGRDINYSSPDWWGGTYDPDISIKEGLSQYGPLLGQFQRNPFATAIKSMKLDPMKDKLFQDRISGFLESVQSDMSLEDVIEAYNLAINNNYNSKVNAEDTARGIVYGADPKYQSYFQEAVKQHGMRPDEFAGWVDSVNQFNAMNPTSPMGYSAIEALGPSAITPSANFDPRFSAAWNYAKTFGINLENPMSESDRNVMDRLNESKTRRDQFQMDVFNTAFAVDPEFAAQLVSQAQLNQARQNPGVTGSGRDPYSGTGLTNPVDNEKSRADKAAKDSGGDRNGGAGNNGSGRDGGTGMGGTGNGTGNDGSGGRWQ